MPPDINFSFSVFVLHSSPCFSYSPGPGHFSMSFAVTFMSKPRMLAPPLTYISVFLNVGVYDIGPGVTRPYLISSSKILWPSPLPIEKAGNFFFIKFILGLNGP
jgi:hypothetical protein